MMSNVMDTSSQMGNTLFSFFNNQQYPLNFSCGIIGRGLSKKIVPFLTDFQKPIIDYDHIETTYPCAFQIRYQGYKGRFNGR